MKRRTTRGLPSRRRAQGLSPLVFAVVALVVLCACAATAVLRRRRTGVPRTGARQHCEGGGVYRSTSSCASESRAGVCRVRLMDERQTWASSTRRAPWGPPCRRCSAARTDRASARASPPSLRDKRTVHGNGVGIKTDSVCSKALRRSASGAAAGSNRAVQMAVRR